MTGRHLYQVPSPAAIAVVIPARDEQQLLPACLRSVLSALDAAALPSLVVVVAHRCTDGTADVARRILGRSGVVIADDSADVAGARVAGAARALRHFAATEPGRVWLFSTDADTTVPRGWVDAVLRHGQDGPVAVAGLADIGSLSELSAPGRRAYRDLVAAGIHGDRHQHAYAANLAVRADAYLDVGGWPRVSPGEEHALLAALASAGWPVRRPADVVVTTSGRLNARAAGGLGDLLDQLAHDPDSAVSSAVRAVPTTA